MLVLPAPMIVALLFGFVMLQGLARRETPWPLLCLIAACATQAVVISLHQHYGLAPLRHVQPVSATVIPPLAYLAFHASPPARGLPHLSAPLAAALCAAFAPALLDLSVPAVFLGYGLALLFALRQARAAGAAPRLLWWVIGLALVLSAAGDGLIALDQTLGEGELRPWMVTVLSGLALLALGFSGFAGPAAPGKGARDAVDPEAERALLARLDALVEAQQLYLDPQMTLGRMARRLKVPAKRLSAAINRVRGENVSRYLNGFRIDHACERLAAGEGVTRAMLSSGFNTKSNFNREFLRIKGCPPSRWLAERGG